LLAPGGEDDRPAPENGAGAHHRDLEASDPLHAEGGEDCWPHRPYRRVHERANRSRRPNHLAGTTLDVLESH